MKMKILKHLTFVSVSAGLWIGLSGLPGGIGWNIVVVLGSLHLGIVTYKYWPTAPKRTIAPVEFIGK